MADHSAIEWTDATWNPITGCSIVSPGCVHCYAMKLAGTRLKHIESRKGLTRETAIGPVWTGEVRLNEKWLDQPLRWKQPRRIFVCAHGDLFAENVPDDWIDRVFAIMALAPQHTFQVLTKRAKRMREYLTQRDAGQRLRADAVEVAGWNMVMQGQIGHAKPTIWPLPNVWLGVSAERQKEADDRVPELLATPAAIRFISAEPLLGRIDFGKIIRAATFAGTTYPDGKTHPIGWMIVGGESGPGARPMHPNWVRQIRDDFTAAGVPFFFKQWGAWWPQECNPLPQQRFAERLRTARITPSIEKPLRGCWGVDDKWDPGKIAGALPAYTSWKIGKKAAGRLLDGVEHSEFPKVAA
ncbi:phage Gp37/Gp68 family protein [Mesorhizobium sp.]|uniref:DUF5131 family protein n=1 Tax=Mesorhizobium sp. TaxID=1871066 RepID=UPI001201B0D6|nr:phage Gp37/Gp68 family protein [Mesorhizobium sp.]TIL54349.1 MAG: phage Gp37/Gp68 family protein [Mesorhizobium sp.]